MTAPKARGRRGESAADATASELLDSPTVYTPANPNTVAEVMNECIDDWHSSPDEQLETRIAHVDAMYDLARYDGEILHATEFLDVLYAERLAALAVLSRRQERGYAIDGKRPGGFDREWLDELKQRVSIADLVQPYGLKLHRAGRRGFMAHCPFPDHADRRSPSFYVYQDTNSCWCFGCLRGGDVYSFVMLMEGLDFPTSVRKLAAHAGLPVPAPAQPARPSRRRNNPQTGPRTLRTRRVD